MRISNWPRAEISRHISGRALRFSQLMSPLKMMETNQLFLVDFKSQWVTQLGLNVKRSFACSKLNKGCLATEVSMPL